MIEIIATIFACVFAAIAMIILLASNFIDIEKLNDGDNKERNTL